MFFYFPFKVGCHDNDSVVSEKSDRSEKSERSKNSPPRTAGRKRKQGSAPGGINSGSGEDSERSNDSTGEGKYDPACLANKWLLWANHRW